MLKLLYIVLASIICGCSASSSRQTTRLDEAQLLLSEKPAEAFRMLNAMDISEFRDSATMARWAMMYSEAMAANKLCAPTDTIINIALDYYGRHNIYDKLHRAKTLKHYICSKKHSKEDRLATALYIQKEKEFYLFKEKTKKEQYALIGIIAIMLATGIIVWQRQRLMLERTHNDALVAEASGLRRMLRDNNSNISQMENTLHDLLEKRFALIDSLCDTYYESQGTKAERKVLAEKVKTEISSLKNDKRVFEEMENTVNKCRANLLERLKEEYTGMKAEDYQMAVYLACGMSNRTISMLLGKTIDVVYKRKSRIKSKIKERNLPHAADFASIF